MPDVQRKVLTFVHLSDIHFRKDVSETVHDIDSTLRDAIEADIVDQLNRLGSPQLNGILLTGDIAFGGKAEEYAAAKNWLQKIAAAVEQDPGDVVYCVPGNHDVDRDLVNRSPTIQDAHSAIRSKNSDDYNPTLVERLRDQASRDTLFSSMHAYNREFAWIFSCSCAGAAPFWEKETYLNDGSELHIRGLTSTLLSGYRKEKGELVLGRLQTSFRKQPNVVYLTMCHHPPDWFRDCDPIEDDLDAAKIQLFGHKHRARVTRINNTVRVSAGAVHPERNGDWKPGYNILQVWVEGAPDARKLKIDIHAREWQEAPPTQFKAYKDENGEEVWKYEFPLPQWNAPPSVSIAIAGPKDLEPGTMTNEPNKLNEVATAPVQAAKKVTVRSLMFRFSLLPFSRQSEIVADAGLVRDEDRDVEDIERFTRAFQRAVELGLLLDLDARITEAEKH